MSCRTLVDRRDLVVLALAAATSLGLWLGHAQPARAGCSDGACGRVDWTEITETQDGAPIEGKLHGAFAWNASPDGWGSHPLAGSMIGYLWLQCTVASSQGDWVDTSCTEVLASSVEAAPGATVTFQGGFYDMVEGRSIVPPGLYAPDESGPAGYYTVALDVDAEPPLREECMAAHGLGSNPLAEELAQQAAASETSAPSGASVEMRASEPAVGGGEVGARPQRGGSGASCGVAIPLGARHTQGLLAALALGPLGVLAIRRRRQRHARRR